MKLLSKSQMFGPTWQVPGEGAVHCLVQQHSFHTVLTQHQLAHTGSSHNSSTVRVSVCSHTALTESYTQSGSTCAELILLSLCSEAHLLSHAETIKHLLVSCSSGTSLMLHSPSLKQKVVTVIRHPTMMLDAALVIHNCLGSFPGHSTMAQQYKCNRRYVRLILAANCIQLDVLQVYWLAYNKVTSRTNLKGRQECGVRKLRTSDGLCLKATGKQWEHLCVSDPVGCQ